VKVNYYSTNATVLSSPWLKGQVLTTVERGWVDEYLRLEPQFGNTRPT
jgi:hypothetical protein